MPFYRRCGGKAGFCRAWKASEVNLQLFIRPADAVVAILQGLRRRETFPFFLFRLSYFSDPIEPLLAFVPSDIPFLEKHLDEVDQHLRIIWIDIDNEVDVFFHVGSYIANATYTVDGLNTFFGDSAGRFSIIYKSVQCLDSAGICSRRVSGLQGLTVQFDVGVIRLLASLRDHLGETAERAYPSFHLQNPAPVKTYIEPTCRWVLAKSRRQSLQLFLIAV